MSDVSQIGLGLAFCKMVFEAHGGEICVINNQPQGAIFEITLAAELTAITSTHKTFYIIERGAIMSQFSILIVDDEPDNFDVIETLLSEHDYQLHYAASGQEAIASLDLAELAAGNFSITSIYKKETTVHLTLQIVCN
jgi:hypothetical protein